MTIKAIPIITNKRSGFNEFASGAIGFDVNRGVGVRPTREDIETVSTDVLAAAKNVW